jgi:hypothetical protein
VHPDSGLGENPPRQVRGFLDPLEAVRSDVSLEIDDAEGFASVIASELSPKDILRETRAERGGLECRQVGVTNFCAEAESEIQCLKKRAAALEKDSREIDPWLRSVIQALKKFRGESCCRLASRYDPGFTRNHEEVQSKGRPCYRVLRDDLSCEGVWWDRKVKIQYR